MEENMEQLAKAWNNFVFLLGCLPFVLYIVMIYRQKEMDAIKEEKFTENLNELINNHLELESWLEAEILKLSIDQSDKPIKNFSETMQRLQEALVNNFQQLAKVGEEKILNFRNKESMEWIEVAKSELQQQRHDLSKLLSL